MKKILNLFSLFFGVISLCVFTLICHIVFIYPNLNRPSSNDSNAIIAQMDASAIDTAPITNTSQEESPLSLETSIDQASDTNSGTDLQIPAIEQAASDNQDIPAEYQNALSKANDYSNAMYMSKAAIYDQLTSEYGEHFSPEAAQYAIDNIVADWNSNALQKAKDYSDTMYMSKAAIYDQLLSDNGEKFTQAEAQYAVDNLITDYNSNALQKAREYQNTMNMSSEAIRDQLTSEYGERFTPEQANYAVANLSSNNNQENSSTLYSLPIEQSTSSANYISEDPVQNTVTQNTSDGNYNTISVPESQVSTGDGNNFNTYNNSAQQQTNDSYVLNSNPDRMRIHIPTCRDVKKIAPENYSTTNLSISELEAQGYSKCGHCLK